MDSPRSPGKAMEQFRTAYLQLRSALYDRATDLPAFPVLFPQLRSALDDRRRLGVLHLEMPAVELVESLYGWQVFDRILQRVSGLLRGALGHELPERTLLGISGVAGDRFVGFVVERPDGKEVDEKYMELVAKALRRKLDHGFKGDEFAGLSPKLVFRVGHALLSQDPFYRFERRIYAAIDQARGVDERRHKRVELSWGEELQGIMQQSEVGTVFQPVVDLETREVLGHEAFARGPKDSLFEMPGVLFALSNRLGVEAELDRLCRETALRASARVAQRGKLFLNVLPQCLENSEGVESEVAAQSLEPADLVLEVSERCASGDPTQFVAQLTALREQGFGLALDDVGAGYGSREIVEHMRPDYVKLDVSLVHNIHESLIQQEVLATLVQLARHVGAQVIAEGIESEEEVAVLKQAGARYGQGYLFAVPSPPTSSHLGRKTRGKKKSKEP